MKIPFINRGRIKVCLEMINPKVNKKIMNKTQQGT